MYAVIDIGSNTIRLSLYQVSEEGIKLVLNKKHMTGLAGHVDKHGKLSTRGIQKAIQDLLDFKHIIQALHLETTFVFATASLRNIANTDQALYDIKRATAFDIELITGEEEARLDFLGAAKHLSLTKGLLIDIGGGSTELVVFSEGNIQEAYSMPIGSLSLYSRYVQDIIPDEAALRAMKSHVKKELRHVNLKESQVHICGIGGTVRGALKLTNQYHQLPFSNRRIQALHIKEMLKRFQESRPHAVSQIIKTIPDRVHTIIPGMVILNTVAKAVQAEEILVSDYGVREGYLMKKLLSSSQ